MPSTVPTNSGSIVSSRMLTPAGIYGRKVVKYGLSGLNPTRSGYSFAGMLSLDIRFDLQQVLKNGECAGVRKRRYFTRAARASATYKYSVFEPGSVVQGCLNEFLPQRRKDAKKEACSPAGFASLRLCGRNFLDKLLPTHARTNNHTAAALSRYWSRHGPEKDPDAH